MAYNSLLKVGKSIEKIKIGTYFLRTCYQDTNRSSSTGQASCTSQDATYGAPEYFQYNENSFYDIHAEMEKYRLPKPSSKTNDMNKK